MITLGDLLFKFFRALTFVLIFIMGAIFIHKYILNEAKRKYNIKYSNASFKVVIA
jgi:hypothetical protein